MGAPLDGKPSIPATTAGAVDRVAARAGAARSARPGDTALELQALVAIDARRAPEARRARAAGDAAGAARRASCWRWAARFPACADLRDAGASWRRRAARALAAAARGRPSATPATPGWRSAIAGARARPTRSRRALGAADDRLSPGAPSASRAAPVDAGVGRARACWSCRCARCRRSRSYLDGGAAAGVIETDRDGAPRARSSVRGARPAGEAARVARARRAAAPLAPPATPRAGGGAPPRRDASAPQPAVGRRAAGRATAVRRAPRPPDRSRGARRLGRSARPRSRRAWCRSLERAHQLPPGGRTPRARAAGARRSLARWAELLLDEDPTSPDVLELAALDRRPGRRASAAPSASWSTWSTSRPIATRGWCAPRASGSGWGRCRRRRARPGCAPRAGATSPTIRRGAARSRACGAIRARASWRVGAAPTSWIGRRPSAAPPPRPRSIPSERRRRRLAAVPLGRRRGAGQRPTGGRPVPCDTRQVVLDDQRVIERRCRHGSASTGKIARPRRRRRRPTGWPRARAR